MHRVYSKHPQQSMYGHFGRPRVHDMSQLGSIFIICSNELYHEQWTKKWPEIKDVFTDIVPICEALKQTAQQVEHNATPISFVASGKRADQLEPSFMYTQLIKEIILTIQFDDTHRQHYVNYCREIYVDDLAQIAHIKRLEQEYTRHSPIWWYTSQCFLYSMLNCALRSMQGDIITDMGFFIKDLHQHIDQLHKEQFDGASSQRVLTLYRGQGLSSVDFEQLQQSKGGLISFNSFLSTSYDRMISMVFAESSAHNPDQVGILFVMKIHPDRSTTPFASIADVSAFSVEGEVLFSMHSVFRINDIQPMSDNNRLFEVHLTLTSDNDAELSTLTHHIREDSYPKKDAWYRLGVVLLKMGQPNKAEEIYRTLLHQTSDEKETASINYQLGQVKHAQGTYKKAIALYKKSLAVYQKFASSDPLSLADLYNCMGLAYCSIGDYSEALKTHHRVLTIREQSLPAHHIDMARSYSNIGNVYHSMGDYEKALSSHEKALTIYQQSLPPNHLDLALSHDNIGLMYYSMGDYDKALSFHDKAVVIRQESLPPNHPHLATSYTRIGTVYYSMGDYKKALSSHEKALAIHQQSLPPNHPHLATSYTRIGSVYHSMGDYDKALSFHKKALTIYQQSLPPSHPHLATSYNNIGAVYYRMCDYEKALSSHEKALSIYQQSLPPNHPHLATSYGNIGNVYYRRSDYHKALYFHQKALAIYLQSLPANHPDLAMSYYNIGLTFENMHDYFNARSSYERAVHIAQQSLPADHPSLPRYKNKLANVTKKP